MEITIKEYRFDPEETLRLYESVGWTAYAAKPEKLQRAFENSLSVLGAFDGEKLLGIIRAVGDGETIVFIQDLLVFPEYQRKGVGRALMSAVLEKYRGVRQIELATDDVPETVGFYKALGFREMSELGCAGFMKMST